MTTAYITNSHQHKDEADYQRVIHVLEWDIIEKLI